MFLIHKVIRFSQAYLNQFKQILAVQKQQVKMCRQRKLIEVILKHFQQKKQNPNILLKKKSKKLQYIQTLIIFKEKKENINLQIMLYIMESGLKINEMVMVQWYGLINQGMRVIGQIIKLMVTVNFFIQMGTHMKVNGKIIKLMVQVYFKVAKVDMKVAGLMIYKMVLVQKFGMIDLNLREIIKKGKNVVTEFILGKMGQVMKEIFQIIKWKVLVNLLFQMVGVMKGNIKIIQCMVKVPIFGQTVGNLLGNINMIKNMDQVFLHNQMENHMRVFGNSEIELKKKIKNDLFFKIIIKKQINEYILIQIKFINCNKNNSGQFIIKKIIL